MRYHLFFTRSQANWFDAAWQAFAAVSTGLFALIVAGPMIRTALLEDPSAWLAVPGYLAGAGTCFFVVVQFAGGQRARQYAPWSGHLRSFGWWEGVKERTEVRTINKQLARALAEDLQWLEHHAPELERATARLRAEGLDIMERDVRALRREMVRRGRVSKVHALATPSARRARREYANRVDARFDHEKAWDRVVAEVEAEDAALALEEARTKAAPTQ